MNPVYLFLTVLISTSCVHGDYTEFYNKNGEVVACEGYYSSGKEEWISDAIVADQRYKNCISRARRNGWTSRPPSEEYEPIELSPEERKELEAEATRLRKEIRKIRKNRG
ncbi:MAG: hypothetical protein CMP10_01665 [Zetaproteobacteria bacterium]|nr:hypothetical protein [Pseudobdellovibrionaceae bacterium]